MPRRRAELRGQERLHEIPGHGRANDAATDADDVHVIVFDSLSRRKVIVNQSGPGPRNLVRADRGAHAAAADGHSALHRARRHRAGEWDDEVRIVVVGAQLVRAEVDDVVSGGAQSPRQVLLQCKAPVISRDAHAHGVFSALWLQRSDGRGAANESARRAPAASWSASTTASSRRTRPAGIDRSPAYRRTSMSAFSGPV